MVPVTGAMPRRSLPWWRRYADWSKRFSNVPDPTLADGEAVVLDGLASMVTGLRTAQGGLVVTTTRLVFLPFNLGFLPVPWLARRPVELPLSSVAGVERDRPWKRWGSFPGLPRFVVTATDGTSHTFQSLFVGTWIDHIRRHLRSASGVAGRDAPRE
jgi:hypothetical protein